MATMLKEDYARLRMGVGSVGLATGGAGSSEVRESGVVVFKEIPVGASVFARVDRPTELPESDAGAAGSAGAIAPYAFEAAPRPAPFLCGSNGAITSNGLNRVLVTDGRGAVTRYGQVPVFAALAAPATGSLKQKGKLVHLIAMPTPDFGGTHQSLDSANPLLRIRWTGTVQGATNLVVTDGALRTFSGKFPNSNIKLVPGSIVITGLYGGNAFTAYDDGTGRLIGIQVAAGAAPQLATLAIDGTVNYIEGTYTLSFSDGMGGGAPDAGHLQAAYEYGCNYIPIDAHLSWDSDAQ